MEMALALAGDSSLKKHIILMSQEEIFEDFDTMMELSIQAADKSAVVHTYAINTYDHTLLMLTHASMGSFS